jgi:hypothetical protein
MANGTVNVADVRRPPGATIAEKLGASAGIWAVLYLTINYLIIQRSTADLTGNEADFVGALVNERMSWEWATALRVMGGIMIIWYMGSLASRVRLAEGEPGRLASIGFGLGTVWGAIWLLSAMFNSAAIVLAADYRFPAGARFAAIVGRDMVLILTAPIVFALALSVSFVGLRYGGFPKAYTYGTAALTIILLALALVDWYGPGNLGTVIMAAAFGWTAVTSALLIPVYRPPDMVRGSR